MTITLYTKEHCALCELTKRQLIAHKVSFSEKSVEENRNYLQQQGFLTAPVLIASDGTTMSGFQPDTLARVMTKFKEER